MNTIYRVLLQSKIKNKINIKSIISGTEYARAICLSYHIRYVEIKLVKATENILKGNKPTQTIELFSVFWWYSDLDIVSLKTQHKISDKYHRYLYNKINSINRTISNRILIPGTIHSKTRCKIVGTTHACARFEGSSWQIIDTNRNGQNFFIDYLL